MLCALYRRVAPHASICRTLVFAPFDAPSPAVGGMPRTGESQSIVLLLLLSVLGVLVATAGLVLRRRIKAKID
jgi:LPXTG-motif cell wall-anchored protein